MKDNELAVGGVTSQWCSRSHPIDEASTVTRLGLDGLVAPQWSEWDPGRRGGFGQDRSNHNIPRGLSQALPRHFWPSPDCRSEEHSLKVEARIRTMDTGF